jgi:hypothetical protein
MDVLIVGSSFPHVPYNIDSKKKKKIGKDSDKRV